MTSAETEYGQFGPGPETHAPSGKVDGQMGDGSSPNEQNNNDDGHKGDDNAKASSSRNRAHDKKGKQSFASLFKDNRVPDESSMLKYIDPPVGNIKLALDEIESVESTHGFCLVGYVYGSRPSPYAFVNYLKGWGGNIKFFFKENGWIKFQFTTESERDRVLNGGPYMILGRQLFLKELPSCFLYSKDDMMLFPSWVQIIGLPAECWTAKALSRVASVVGKPLHTDKLTISKKGANYARVLVELDAKKPRVWEQAVVLPSGISISVKFKYEFDPKYCGNCNSLGHISEMCGVKVAPKVYKQKAPAKVPDIVTNIVDGQPSQDSNSASKVNIQPVVGSASILMKKKCIVVRLPKTAFGLI